MPREQGQTFYIDCIIFSGPERHLTCQFGGRGGTRAAPSDGPIRVGTDEEDEGAFINDVRKGDGVKQLLHFEGQQ